MAKAESPFFSIGRINIKKGLRNPLRHNLREALCGSHIDPSRSVRNYRLIDIGNSEQVEEWANALINEAGCHVRVDACLAVEVLFSLPASWLEVDTRPYFKDCLHWLTVEYKGLEILDFSVHLDEGAPHAHALILALKDGKLQGNKIAGDRQTLRLKKDSFFEAVAKKHGFEKTKRLNKAEAESLFKSLILEIENEGHLTKSKLYNLIRDEIRKNPAPYALALGIEAEPKRGKERTFAQIMTKPVKSL